MLFMIVERFKEGNAARVHERFMQSGRMLPPDVTYVDSWIESTGARCFQLMEAPALESLYPWINQWKDLVDFEVVPVLRSSEYWRNFS
jgi:hypothetical protein